MTKTSVPNLLPLTRLNGEKRDYFCLDEQGKLQHWQFKKESWTMLTHNLFQQNLQGFDGASDATGLFHLLGYDHKGQIFHLDPSGNMDEPQMIYADPEKIIVQLSCCFDSLSQLYILYLNADELNKKHRLFILNKGEQDWQQPYFLDTVNDPAGSYCSLLCDRQDNVYIIYPFVDEERQRLSFRKLERENRKGRVYLFPGNQGGLCRPSYYCDGENNIHIAWINSTAESSYLNYIQREKTGGWRHYLQTPVPPQTLPASPIFSQENQLIIHYHWDQKIGWLYSRDQGMNWNKGKDKSIGQHGTLSRLIINQQKEEPAGRDFFFNFNILWENTLNKVSTERTVPKAVQPLSNSITPHAVNNAQNTEVDNSRQAEKLQETEKELSEIKLRQQSQRAELEAIIKKKTHALNEAESLFQQKLQKQRKELKKEKESLKERLEEHINLLRGDVLKLQAKNEKLLQEKAALEQRTTGNETAAKKHNLFYFLIQMLKTVKAVKL